MNAGGDPVPSEGHDPEKGGFEHECHGGLEPEHMPEEIASRNGKGSPVGAELEFHGNAAHHAYGEIDQKQPAPEAAMAIVDNIAGLEPQGFHDYQKEAQPNGQHGPQDVEVSRQGELKPR